MPLKHDCIFKIKFKQVFLCCYFFISIYHCTSQWDLWRQQFSNIRWTQERVNLNRVIYFKQVEYRAKILLPQGLLLSAVSEYCVRWYSFFRVTHRNTLIHIWQQMTHTHTHIWKRGNKFEVEWRVNNIVVWRRERRRGWRKERKGKGDVTVF